ncbi:hypothetical protein OAB57_00550 [Bacteriovoracaceae bacterium]|nr:hypothetical protein [Bacteriovoracaceae bacterium]
MKESNHLCKFTISTFYLLPVLISILFFIGTAKASAEKPKEDVFLQLYRLLLPEPDNESCDNTNAAETDKVVIEHLKVCNENLDIENSLKTLSSHFDSFGKTLHSKYVDEVLESHLHPYEYYPTDDQMSDESSDNHIQQYTSRSERIFLCSQDNVIIAGASIHSGGACSGHPGFSLLNEYSKYEAQMNDENDFLCIDNLFTWPKMLVNDSRSSGTTLGDELLQKIIELNRKNRNFPIFLHDATNARNEIFGKDLLNRYKNVYLRNGFDVLDKEYFPEMRFIKKKTDL